MKRVNIFIEIQSQIEGLDSALTKGPERVGKNVGLPATATIYQEEEMAKSKDRNGLFHAWLPILEWDKTGGFVQCEKCGDIVFLNRRNCLRYLQNRREVGYRRIRMHPNTYC